LCTAAVIAGNASSLSLLSGISAGESNNKTGANILVTSHPSGAIDPLAKWVSFEDTGFGGMELPNTDLTMPSAIFYQDFTVKAFDSGGVQGTHN
jgi:hypothetical protein